MRRESRTNSRAVQKRETDHECRQWFRQQNQVCWICGWTPQMDGMNTLEKHHISGRNVGPPERWNRPVNLFVACRRCHDQRIPHMTKPEQLYLKLCHDPEHFCLEQWLRIEDRDLRAPERITMDEVLASGAYCD